MGSGKRGKSARQEKLMGPQNQKVTICKTCKKLQVVQRYKPEFQVVDGKR